MRFGLLLVAVLLTAATTADAASLRQLAGRPLPGGSAVAVAPDGRAVYVTANEEEEGKLLVYARNVATGALTRVECWAESARDGCTATAAAFGANDVTVSADGRTVYLLGALPGSVGVFARDTRTGALTEQQCFGESSRSARCVRAAFDNVWKFTLTPDGTGLIVGGSQITRFAVGPGGLLSDAVQEDFGVRNPAAIAMGPSARRVFAAGGLVDNGKLTIFARDPATGALSPAGCAGDGTAGGRPCRRAAAIESPADLAVAPDGRGVYLATSSFTGRPFDPFSFSGTQHSSALAAFSPAGRQRACVVYAGRAANREGCDRAPRARGLGFRGASAVAISPDGRVAVAGFEKGRALLVLRRNARTQGLTPQAGKAGCVRDPGNARRRPEGCQVGRDIHAPTDIAIAPDSRHAYVTSRTGFTAFALRTR